ncbi:MAG: hypothetical protein WBB85_02335 [Albidovulum sp.]|uniref:hypothetical protein n=1 Tax=Albidovulum sp. TaxID=1872424 RepID=UPI003C9D0FFC
MKADLDVGHAALDIDILSLLWSVPTIEDVALRQVTGDLVLPLKAESDTDDPATGKPRRDFIVELGRFEALDLTVAQGDKPSHRIEIARASVEPFRSRMAVFDVFFRSNLGARIDRVPLSVVT